MFPQTNDDQALPAPRTVLTEVLPTTLTLAVVLLLGAWWLLREGGSPDPAATPAVVEHTTPPLEIATGQEKGGFAELQDELARVKAATSAPFTIYLVASTEQQQAMTARGLADGEMVLVAGTPETMAAAQLHIEWLTMNLTMAPEARSVQVVDLRRPPVTHATESSLQVAPDAASDQRMRSRWQASRLATGDEPSQTRPTEVVQTVYLVRSPDQADALRDTLGEPPLTAAVLVIGAEDERIVRALGDADAIRDGLSLPGLTVVDLRTPR